MYSRVGKTLLAGLAGLLVTAGLTACGPDDKQPPDLRPEAQAGNVIDVQAALTAQGWKHISVIQRNSAYWLMPFQTVMQMNKTQVPGNVTCVFKITNVTYPGEGALALSKHLIRDKSRVRVIGHIVGSDGVLAASLTPGAEVALHDLTPRWLVEDSDMDLGVCGDLTIR